MKPYSNNTPATASGTAELDFTPPSTYDWEVNQIGISCSGKLSSTVQVFLDQRFMCGSNSGNADAADGSPITVRNGSSLRVLWSGCTPDSICKANLLVDEIVGGYK